MNLFLHSCILSAFLWFSACAGVDESKGDVEEVPFPDIFDIQLRPLDTGDSSVVELLSDLNDHLRRQYRENPKAVIVIDVHPDPSNDTSDQIPRLSLPAQSLGERLVMLATIAPGHFRQSLNGYTIFKTWHRPQYASDSEPLSTDTNTEQSGADRPLSR